MLMVRILSIFCIALLLTRAPWPIVKENPLWFLSIFVFITAIGLAVGKVLLMRKYRLRSRCAHIEQKCFDVAIRYVGQSKVQVIGFSWDGPQFLDDGQYHLHVTVLAVPVSA
jgi:hypothetical protein